MIPPDEFGREVVEAVGQGKLHIYAVSTIEEGLVLLTGLVAGRPRRDGSYPKGTVNRAVCEAIDCMIRPPAPRPPGRGGGDPWPAAGRPASRAWAVGARASLLVVD